VYDELTSFLGAAVHRVLLLPGKPVALIVTFVVPSDMNPSLLKIQIVSSKILELFALQRGHMNC
jgi:hypothetical protein